MLEKFTIFKHSTSATGGEDGRGEETVGGEEAGQPEWGGEGLEDGRGDDGFQKTEISTLISDWERRAGG